MAFPSKEQLMSGDFDVDQETYRTDLEEKIKRIIELAASIEADKNDKPANQQMAH